MMNSNLPLLTTLGRLFPPRPRNVQFERFPLGPGDDKLRPTATPDGHPGRRIQAAAPAYVRRVAATARRGRARTRDRRTWTNCGAISTASWAGCSAATKNAGAHAAAWVAAAVAVAPAAFSPT